jgi:hypothetical protein
VSQVSMQTNPNPAAKKVHGPTEPPPIYVIHNFFVCK